MINLEERELKIVRQILLTHLPECDVRLFGSRVRGTARKYSDIDLVVAGDGPVPEGRISCLLDAFSESDLPYRVDVVDWHRITPEFRKVIDQQPSEIIQEKRP